MKFCVIGLGRLGYHIATILAENGMEILAVDSNESTIASIRNNVTHAVCMRVTDEKSLQSIGVEEMDTVIVAMGENFSQSILVTTLLKKRLNVPHVIARGINEVHKEILLLVGADEVILPEQEVGIRLGDRLSSPFKYLMRLTKKFAIVQLAAPEKFVGKKIQDLSLFKEYEVHCIGIAVHDEILPLSPEHSVTENDVLCFSGYHKDLEYLAKL